MPQSTVSKAQSRVNGVNGVKRQIPAKKAPLNLSKTAQAAKATPPVPHAMNGASPFEIMASRIANRVAEMAENVTFAERQP